MTKIKQDYNKIPSWLNCSRQMAPDFVVKDPKNSPVWEITGAEFSKADLHTADGISIRFPRVTKIRDDKDWKTSTSLEQLKDLYETSKQSIDIDLRTDSDETDKIIKDESCNTGNVSVKPKRKSSDIEYSPAEKKIKIEGKIASKPSPKKGNSLLRTYYILT